MTKPKKPTEFKPDPTDPLHMTITNVIEPIIHTAEIALRRRLAGCGKIEDLSNNELALHVLYAAAEGLSAAHKIILDAGVRAAEVVTHEKEAAKREVALVQHAKDAADRAFPGAKE